MKLSVFAKKLGKLELFGFVGCRARRHISISAPLELCVRNHLRPCRLIKCNDLDVAPESSLVSGMWSEPVSLGVRTYVVISSSIIIIYALQSTICNWHCI